MSSRDHALTASGEIGRHEREYTRYINETAAALWSRLAASMPDQTRSPLSEVRLTVQPPVQQTPAKSPG